MASAAATEGENFARRIDRLESRIAIGELPTRYARAIDALRRFIEPSVRTFYRSVHFVCGHTVDFIDDDSADGTVYCRAEHEDGDQWLTMAIVYFDRYVRRDGRWYFEWRREKHWYSVDELDRPRAPFQLWVRWIHRARSLPADFPIWNGFWDRTSAQDIAQITRLPVAPNAKDSE